MLPLGNTQAICLFITILWVLICSNLLKPPAALLQALHLTFSIHLCLSVKKEMAVKIVGFSGFVVIGY